MKIAIIIDNQTSLSNIGFAGENTPRASFPTIFGYAKLRFPPSDKEYYYPDEVLQNEKDCGISRPIEHGLIDNWVTMINLWEWSFSKLEVDPKEHPALVTLAKNSSIKIIEKVAEIMFETFDIPVLCIKDQSFLSAYALENTKASTSDIKEYSSWLGGSLLATEEWFKQNSVTFEEYWEVGPTIIHRVFS